MSDSQSSPAEGERCVACVCETRTFVSLGFRFGGEEAGTQLTIFRLKLS